MCTHSHDSKMVNKYVELQHLQQNPGGGMSASGMSTLAYLRSNTSYLLGESRSFLFQKIWITFRFHDICKTELGEKKKGAWT